MVAWLYTTNGTLGTCYQENSAQLGHKTDVACRAEAAPLLLIRSLRTILSDVNFKLFDSKIQPIPLCMELKYGG